MKKCKVGDICLYVGYDFTGKIFEVVREPYCTDRRSVTLEGNEFLLVASTATSWEIRSLSGPIRLSPSGKIALHTIAIDAALMPLRPDPTETLEREKELTL